LYESFEKDPILGPGLYDSFEKDPILGLDLYESFQKDPILGPDLYESFPKDYTTTTTPGSLGNSGNDNPNCPCLSPTIDT
jgi:hypothetical protein